MVDDDENICFTTRQILTTSGYKVFVAKDGNEGLELFKKHADSIDLVILDEIMPQVLGHDLFVELRKLNPQIRIIMASGFSIDERLESLDCPFIRKPYKFYELLQLIAQTLAGDKNAKID